jgi:tetratricopeptide (TPR) repeat protein
LQTTATSCAVEWSAATFERQAAPEQAIALLRRALERAPDNPRLLASLAAAQTDRYDFVAAAATYDALLRVAPTDSAAAIRLARCLIEAHREAEALALLEGLGEAAPETLYQRAVALTGLERLDEAEGLLRAVLAAQPTHAGACGALMRLLRKADRHADALATSEARAGRGVRHAQLLLDWGYALAARGERRRAAALMFDRARLGRFTLPAPAPFVDAGAFCAAFADELTAHPLALSDLGRRDANRGSRRVHQLLGGRRPELARSLVATLQALVDRFVGELAAAAGEPDPWLEARPRRARLSCWGLIQRAGEYEEWHSHPAGWLSGVCYLRLPAAFSVDGDGAGCIEFGPPPALAAAGLAPCAPLRIAPQEGLVLLSPSHFLHRTIPFADPGTRISFAFDVVPDAG